MFNFHVSTFIANFCVRREHPMPAMPPSPVPSLPPPPPPPKDFRVMKPLPVVADHAMSSTEHVPPPQVPPKVILRGRAAPVHLSPEERLKRQLSTQRRRQREEEDALREEEERQARRKREKAESEQSAREDEQRRKAILQDQLRQAAARKAEEEREAQAIEERRLREIKERKQSEHERRLQYTREMQQWRHEHIRRAESQSSEKEEERRRSTEQRRSRIQRISDAVLQDAAPEAFNGWVTIQTPDHLAWKRRYFMFDLARAQLSLCRSQRVSATSAPLRAYTHSRPRIRHALLPSSTWTVASRASTSGTKALRSWKPSHIRLRSSLSMDALGSCMQIPNKTRHVPVVCFINPPSYWHIQDRLLVLLSEAAGVIL